MGIHPKFDVVRQGAGYVVLKDDEVVQGPTSRQIAEEAMDRLVRKSKQKRRNCMTCAKPFLSEGPHNRMCKDCRTGRSVSLYDGAV